MQALPQVFASQNSTISNGATGTATVDLRHLGPERTLTLVNGHRMAPGDAFEAGGDMNFIPAVAREARRHPDRWRVVGLRRRRRGRRRQLRPRHRVRGLPGRGHVERLPARQRQRARPGDQPGPGLHRSERQHLQPRRLELQPGRRREDRRRARATPPRSSTTATSPTSGRTQRDYTNCSVQALGAAGPGLRRLRHLAARALPGAGRAATSSSTRTRATRTPSGRGRATDVFNFAPFNFMQRNDQKWGGGHLRPLHDQQALRAVRRSDVHGRLLRRPDRAVGQLLQHDRDQLRQPHDERAAAPARLRVADLRRRRRCSSARRNVEGGNRTSQLGHLNWRARGGRPRRHRLLGLELRLLRPQRRRRLTADLHQRPVRQPHAGRPRRRGRPRRPRQLALPLREPGLRPLEHLLASAA